MLLLVTLTIDVTPLDSYLRQNNNATGVFNSALQSVNVSGWERPNGLNLN